MKLLKCICIALMVVVWVVPATIIAQSNMFQGKSIIEGTWSGTATKWVGGEILLMFQDATVDGSTIANRIGGKMVRGVEPDGFAKIEVSPSADIPTLCRELYNSDSRIRFAEPNFIATIGEWNPNDTYYSNGTQWNLRNTGQYGPTGIPDADIDANYAWDYTRGSSSVILSILDSGIDMDTVTLVLRHDDLNAPGKIIIGPDYIGDGHSVADQNGHGTHVSGIAAAEVNNSTGIAGVAGDCDIMMTQVFDRFGNGSYEALRDGINNSVTYQTSHPSYRVIMNYSGGGTSSSSIVYAALDSAHAHGVPFVTISHNDASSTCRYPCQYSSNLDNIICVGSTDPWDRWSTYSNYCNDVNVSAPGGAGLPFDSDDIYSCYPPNSYTYLAGTSMAAPHVTGVCGLVVTQNMSITAADLRTLIQNTADDQVGTLANDPQGYDNKSGWGRVNAWSALIHSPVYITPYLRNDQRCSNVFTAVGQYKSYRLSAVADSDKWEIAAVRPQAGIDADIYWLDASATQQAVSSYSGQAVDFVLANRRPGSGLDHYAKVRDYSGSGKYCVEYQRATESYIGSMYKDDFQWKSAHVVEIWQLYLQNGHCYTFKADVTSGEVDVGISLVGRTGSGAYYTARTSAVFNIDASGSGGDETTSYTISSGDGWYALVLWSNNGRNGVMDVSVGEQLTPGTPIAINEQNSVVAGNGYFYSYLSAGTTMGVMGIRPNPSNNYDIMLFAQSGYGYQGGGWVESSYTGSTEDFFLYDKAMFTAGWWYPEVFETAPHSGNSGYALDIDDTDETLSLGTNGPFTFYENSVVRAWDVSLTAGVEYQFTADITSGSLNIGIGLFWKDATFVSRYECFRYSYSGGAGVDESFSWLCSATATYTLVAWNQSAAPGNYNILFTNYPNLDAYVPTGWSYEFVPRNTGDATYSSCPITATLPGNTSNTYLNWVVRNHSVNAVPSSPTFYTHLYLDGSFFYDRPWTSGLAGNGELHFTNWTTTIPIRGGKHTVELREDGTNVVAETNESDNSYFRQFVWSPYVLARETPVGRSVPPVYGMYARPNCDGFQFSATAGGYAYGVAIIPRGANDDYDLQGCDDYVGSLSGFDSLRVGSYRIGSITDFFVATWTGVPSTIYPAVYKYSGTGNQDFVIEATDSYGRILASTDATRRDTLSADEIFHVYETPLLADSFYTITLDNISGGANLDLSLYGPDYGYYGATGYTAASWTGSSDEEINYAPTTTGWYIITVHKTAYGALPLTNVYDLTIQPTPPNLVTTIPSGWSYEFVPRNTSGATSGNCLITATLPGNTSNTYLNFCAKNNGVRSVPVTTFYNQLYLDGGAAYYFQRPWSTGLAPGNTCYYLDWTTTTPIRGGRHTMELRLDGTNTIYETNEGDNSVSRQFVWSPYILSNGVAVSRSTPPPYGSFPQPNCDGFQYTRNPSYAYGIAVCPTAYEDFDVAVYTNYTGSESGFSTLAEASYWATGYTDFVVATYSGVASTVYPGASDWYGTGINNYVMEAIDSYGKALAPTDVGLNDTLLANEVLNVYEGYLQAGTNYAISTTALSGTADIALALYGPTYGYYARSDYVAYSDVVGSNETISYTPGTTAWFVVVVFKPYYTQLASQLIYQLSMTVTPTNLTYATPSGWTYPIVPRNVGGATPGSCTLTTTLPGNTANTYYNISSYNAGPNPVTKQYYDYIYIDSVWYYGAVQSPPIAAGAFGLRQNLLAAATVRGGRHTMGLYIDQNDSIPESNENDNWYARQFVWTPYILTDNTPVTRNAAPMFGTGTYPNCDGFEFTTGFWGAVGIIPYNATDDYNLRLHPQWTNSETGFGATFAGSGWSVGQSDFVIGSQNLGYEVVLDAGVVRDFSNPGVGSFVIQQANEQNTWYTPGTYGPFTLPSGQVMGLWEVYLPALGLYSFRVYVVSGTADIGTSLYDGSVSYLAKFGYVTGGFSNSAGGGGDESFSVQNPYSGMFFGWVVWKVGSADRTLTSTFNLIWSSSTRIPMAVDDLVIERVDSTGARLSWSPVTEDTLGNPITVDFYRIYRNANPDFIPSSSDSIAYTSGGTTTYLDPDVVWNQQMYFYRVIAVASGMVGDDCSIGEGNERIATGSPPRSDAPTAIRSRFRQ